METTDVMARVLRSGQLYSFETFSPLPGFIEQFEKQALMVATVRGSCLVACPAIAGFRHSDVFASATTSNLCSNAPAACQVTTE